MRIACVMMARNEELLLEPWFKYHADLFGAENITIVDNGSDDANFLDILKRVEAQGATVDRSHSTRQDFAKKGDIVSEHFRRLIASNKYDYLFPLDCDEFVAVFTDDGISVSRQVILSYLDALPASDKTYRLNHQILNVPKRPSDFYVWGGAKTFYKPDCFAWTDRGFHLDGSKSQKGFVDTNLVYIHCHNKPFKRLLLAAREKLEQFVDIEDREKLKALIREQGPGSHVAPYLLMNETDYINSFLDKPILRFGAFLTSLSSIGTCVSFLLENTHRFEVTPPPAMTLNAVQDPVGIVFDKRTDRHYIFNGNDYLQANPDIATSRIHPVAHYLTWGHTERRLLRR